MNLPPWLKTNRYVSSRSVLSRCWVTELQDQHLLTKTNESSPSMSQSSGRHLCVTDCQDTPADPRLCQWPCSTHMLRTHADSCIWEAVKWYYLCFLNVVSHFLSPLLVWKVWMNSRILCQKRMLLLRLHKKFKSPLLQPKFFHALILNRKSPCLCLHVCACSCVCMCTFARCSPHALF